MENFKYDKYGCKITLEIKNSEECYTKNNGNFILACPLGTGWDRALEIINAHVPVGWVDPQEATVSSELAQE